MLPSSETEQVPSDSFQTTKAEIFCALYGSRSLVLGFRGLFGASGCCASDDVADLHPGVAGDIGSRRLPAPLQRLEFAQLFIFILSELRRPV
jgi:hypothetical protein